jgi:hypothetical protein
MKKSASLLERCLYVLPRFILWGVCMLYIVITIIVTLDMSGDYLYPLEKFRHPEAGGK